MKKTVVRVEVPYNPLLVDVLDYIDDKDFQKDERLYIVCPETRRYAMATKHSKEQLFFLDFPNITEDLIEEETALPEWRIYKEKQTGDPSWEVYYLVKKDQYYCCSVQW